MLETASSSPRRVYSTTWPSLLVAALLSWGCPTGSDERATAECSDDGDCSICASPIFSCIEGCRAPAGCFGESQKSLCSKVASADFGVCSECVSDGDCGSNLFCNNGSCEQCRAHGDCSAGELCCGGTCVGTTDLRLNQIAAGDQDRPALAFDSELELAAVWSAGVDSDIWLRRFGPAGAIEIQEVRVNTTTPGDQIRPDVAREPINSRFVVAWYDQARQLIAAQLYAGDGSPHLAELVVSSAGLEAQTPAVAMGGEGTWAVVWHEADPMDGNLDVHGRLFAFDATLLASFTANVTTAGDQRAPDVAMDLTGSFVVVWESDGQDGDQGGIFGRSFSPIGVGSSEFAVNSAVLGDQTAPRVAFDPGGTNVVAAWKSQPIPGNVQLWGQRLNASGSLQGAAFRIDTVPGTSYEGLDLSSSYGGDTLVAWSQGSSAQQKDVFVRRLSGAGPFPDPVQINQRTCGNQTHAAVALDPDDRKVALAWADDDGSGRGLFSRWLDSGLPISAPAPPPTTPSKGLGGYVYVRSTDPLLAVVPAVAGVSSSHRLEISAPAGGLETYKASWAYPPEFAFTGFLSRGPIGSTVGWYRMDFDHDGQADLERPVLSLGDDSAYADIDGDGDPLANPMLVRIDGPGPRFYLVAPWGGDFDPTTVTGSMATEMSLEMASGLLINPDAPGNYTLRLELTSVDPDTDGGNDGSGDDPLTVRAQLDIVLAPAEPPLFADGFESGDTTGWSVARP